MIKKDLELTEAAIRSYGEQQLTDCERLRRSQELRRFAASCRQAAWEAIAQGVAGSWGERNRSSI
jgi:hypothetical protein